MSCEWKEGERERGSLTRVQLQLSSGHRVQRVQELMRCSTRLLRLFSLNESIAEPAEPLRRVAQLALRHLLSSRLDELRFQEMPAGPPQAELRQRAVTTGPQSATESPPTPPSPPSRPSLSRTQTGDLPHTFDLSNDEPLFSMPLLDMLVVVDAHLELWTRSLRRKAAPWRSKADKLVEESRERARNKIEEARAKVKLPRVSSEQFLSSMLEDSGVKEVLSPKDGEKLERRYREVRERAKESLKKLSVKWEEE